MSMELIVREVAEKEGIASAYDLANRTGIPVHSMYRIWNGKARMIGLDTLDKLCTVLNVKPGQLFKHEAEPDKLPSGGESLNAPRSKPRRGRPRKQDVTKAITGAVAL
jgi:DNA-binding Xre family transcriptional regulator